MENENPSYFAIIPADVRYDKRLKANEKLMYGEITCLANKLGYCFSTNNYFAELYDVTPQAISGWIKNLEKCGYITCEYLHNGTEIKERRIRIVKDTNSTNDEEGNSTKVEKGINKSLKIIIQVVIIQVTIIQVRLKSQKDNIKKSIPITLKIIQNYLSKEN